MSDFVSFLLGIILTGIIWYCVSLNSGVYELEACAKEHNVFKCEQIITYVPITKE